MFQNGYINTLPYLAGLPFVLAFAAFCDWLIISDRMSVTNTRKFASYFSQIGTGVSFAALCLVGCSTTSAIALVVLASAFNNCSMSGYQ